MVSHSTRTPGPCKVGQQARRAVGLGLLFGPQWVYASSTEIIDFTAHWAGIISLLVFVLAYALVIAEESLHLRKSKPVIVAAGIIWVLVALAYGQQGDVHTAEQAMRHNLLEFAELFLFLLAAMTFINTMEERGVFEVLRVWLVTRGFGLRAIYWLTGLLAFFISPVADNLTTALLMATVVMAVGGANTRFVVVACINIVVAANAGGAFSPFGDITTLMVWQKGVVQFSEFFHLFIPSVVNWLVPALIMSFTVPAETRGADRNSPLTAWRLGGCGFVRAHHHHGGIGPQLSAHAAGAGHDDRARPSQILRLLPQAPSGGDPGSGEHRRSQTPYRLLSRAG